MTNYTASKRDRRWLAAVAAGARAVGGTHRRGIDRIDETHEAETAAAMQWADSDGLRVRMAANAALYRPGYLVDAGLNGARAVTEAASGDAADAGVAAGAAGVDDAGSDADAAEFNAVVEVEASVILGKDAATAEVFRDPYDFPGIFEMTGRLPDGTTKGRLPATGGPGW